MFARSSFEQFKVFLNLASADCFKAEWTFFLEESLIRKNCLLIRRKAILKDMPILVKDKPLDEDLVQKESSVVEKNDTTEEGSSWCQPVYFNYKCYSASFLSRARLAGLPKKVGPGTCSSHVFTNPEFLFVIVSLIFWGFFLVKITIILAFHTQF